MCFNEYDIVLLAINPLFGWVSVCATRSCPLSSVPPFELEHRQYEERCLSREGVRAMELLTWFDNRTLIFCLCVLTTVFTALMLGLRAFHPTIAGIVPVTSGLLLGTVSMLMLLTEGTAPLWFAIVCGGTMLFLANMLFYRGVLAFVRDQDYPIRVLYSDEPARRASETRDLSPILYLTCSLAFCVLLYATQLRVDPAACLFALTLPMAITRGLVSWTLFRAAGGRRHIQWLAGTTAFFALTAAFRSTTVVFLKTPMDVMHTDHTQTLALLMSVLMVAVQGVFYSMLFAGNVTATIERQAELDHVSGMLNRRGIETALKGELARARRGGALALLLIDIDHFKGINDRFGHSSGDEALRQTARCLSQVVRVYDVLGRFGGDEFLVLLPQASAEQAMMTAERIRAAIAEHIRFSGVAQVTLSIGASCFIPGDDAIQLLARADAALYQAKHDGRDCTRIVLPHSASEPSPAAASQIPFSCADPLPREA
jgi:diguanylate cyclase (GGDEF)-like protein